ncbi:MAG: ComF family protein [Phycisphaerales bacterium JB050]
MTNAPEPVPSPIDDRFQWPPRQESSVPPIPSPEPVEPGPSRMGASDSARSSWRRVWIEIEREFFKPTIEPIERQVTELGWAREARESSCDRCGRTVGPHEEDEFGCAVCRGLVSPIDRVVRLGEYDDPLDRWIWALKFQRIRSFGRFLGRELACALRDAGVLSNIPVGGIVVQPVPSSRRRRLTRGIDHARVIAESVAKELRVPVVLTLRRAHRPTQRALAPSDRWSNVQGTMEVRGQARGRLTGTRVILIDDVRTTGATGKAAALALKGQPDARYKAAAWGAGEVWQGVIASAE